MNEDESVTPIALAMWRIPFSKKGKVVDILDELEALDVIENVNGPSSWINPLVAVEKPDCDVPIFLDMRQANYAILREKHPGLLLKKLCKKCQGQK